MTRPPHLRLVEDAPEGRKRSAVDKLRMIEWLAAQNQLTINELRCAIMLLELYNNDKGDAWPSYNTMARCLEVDRSTAIRIIAKLVRKGYFEVDPAGGGSWVSNRYRPRWESVAPNASFLTMVKRQTGGTDATSSGSKLVASEDETGGIGQRKLVAPVRPKPSEEPSRGTLSPPTARGRLKRTPSADESASTQGSGVSPPNPQPSADPSSDASLGGSSLEAHPPAKQDGKPETNNQPLSDLDRLSILEAVAAARFDQWNDLQYPAWGELPPIHPAAPPHSRYQTEDEVIAAWFAEIDRAKALTGWSDRKAVAFYMLNKTESAQKKLAKIAAAKHPANYAAVTLANTLKGYERWRAKQRADGRDPKTTDEEAYQTLKQRPKGQGQRRGRTYHHHAAARGITKELRPS